MLAKLTVKQTKFVDGIMAGYSHADAYRAAYNAENMKPETVRRRASDLLNNGIVRASLEKCRAELAKKQLWTREQAVEVLRRVTGETYKGSEQVAAAKELNAMHGFNAPQKHDLTSSDGSMTPKPTTREEIDAEIRALGIDPAKVALDE